MGQPLDVTLLTLPDCHLCDQAHAVLSKLRAEHQMTVTELPWDSPEGTQLTRRDGVAFAPALYINGSLCGYGRISEAAVRNWLKKREAR